MCKGFFRQFPFCTFSCINPWFGWPWDKLWLFFLIAIFIMLQKNVFGTRKNQISYMGLKLPKEHIERQFYDTWKCVIVDGDLCKQQQQITVYIKSQLISKRFFQFNQKTNKKWELETQKRHFEINWPLEI